MKQNEKARRPASTTGTLIKVRDKITKRKRLSQNFLEYKWKEPSEVVIDPKYSAP